MRGTIAVALAAGLFGCQQQGCLEPSSFPAAQRIDNAIQIRLAQPGFERLGRELPALIETLAPGGRLGFEPQCEGDIEVCCNLPPDTCGVALDVQPRSNEAPRFEVSSTANGQGLAITLRSRLRTDPGPIEIEIDGFFVNGECTVDINTERSGQPDIAVTAQIGFSTDPSFGTTQIELGGFEVAGLEEDDIIINGNGNACDFAQNNKDRVITGIRDAIGSESTNMLQVPFCKSCSSDADCAPSGTCALDGSGVGVCELPLPPDADDEATPKCLQQIGVSGRMAAGDLLPGFGSDNPVDLYAVSGHAGAPAGGLTFGINSGLMPTGGSSLDCAPAAPFPELPAGGVGLSPTLEGNTAGQMGDYDIGIAIHKSFLDRAGWAMHQTGLLCTTIDGSQIDSLNADALSLMFPSMIDLIDGASTQVSIRLRPQKPPTFGLAQGAAPVIAQFEDMDVDFFLTVRDRLVRLFSARSDVAVPVGLDVDMDGALMPIVGDLSGAFSNVRITSPGVLAEQGDELASKFETMGQLSVSLLIQSLGPIDLPATTFARPMFTRDGLQAIDGDEFLGIFGQLAIGSSAMPLRRRVTTTAAVIATEVPEAAAYRTLDPARRPAVLIGVSGESPWSEPLEYQVRIDGGAWSPFSPGPTLRISREQLWLAGRHLFEVRARHQGRPDTTDPTPVVLSAHLHPLQAGGASEVTHGGRQRFGAQPPPSERVGGGCATIGYGGGIWLVLVAFVLVLMGSRRGLTLALAVGLSGCIVGGDDNFRGPAYGRWSDVASDGNRALVSTYESRDGVLAVGTVVASGVKQYETVDDAGDVGAWSSIELSGQIARISYQDRGAGDLKMAIEDPALGYQIHAVDDGGDMAVGLYSTLVMRPGGGMGIVYGGSREITGTDAMGEEAEGLATELRYAETDADIPTSGADWSIATVASTEVLERRPLDSVPLGTGLYPSLVYADGEPVVIYCDTTEAALVMATRSGGVWQSQILVADPETAPCAFASAAVDEGGTIHAVFQTTAAHDLRYIAISNGVTGTAEIVDDGGRGMLKHPVGGSARLIIDRSGAPLVLYQDGYTLRLMMARRSSGAWQTGEAADEAAAFGFSIGAAYYGDSLIVSSGAINRRKKQPHVLRTLVLDN